MKSEQTFIISEARKDTGRTWFVVARPGFYRAADGSQKRDASCPKTSGPEWHQERNRALVFKSHRAAARVASKCISAIISPVA